MSTIDNIMQYEAGEMDEDELVPFFQSLVDTGVAWKLQGSYARTANELIEAGLVTRPESKEVSTYATIHTGDDWSEDDAVWCRNVETGEETYELFGRVPVVPSEREDGYETVQLEDGRRVLVQSIDLDFEQGE